MSEPVPTSPSTGAGRQRRMFLIGAVALVAAALGVLAYGGIGDNLVYFWEPTDLVAAGDEAYGPTIRLGGLVKADTLDWQEESQQLRFVVTDGAQDVRVYATGAPPQMMREGIGVVVEGTMGKDDVFQTDRLMVKHSNEYRAPQDGVASEELYKTTEGLE